MGIVKLSKAGFKSSTYEKYDSFLAGNPYYVPPAYDSIATVIVGSGGASSVTFSSIPGTYTDLQIRSISRDARAYYGSPIDLTFNGSSATAYARHRLAGDGSSASSGADTSQTFMRLEGGGNTANTFNASIIDILDYTSTSKNKTVRQLAGIDANGSGDVTLVSGLWYATPAAITSITLTPFSSPFAQYSKFALYGIKG